MDPLRLRIAHMPRFPTFPADDDALGAELWRELGARQKQGAPRPSLFVFAAENVQIVDLVPILARGGDVHRAISAFAATEGAEALAASGVMIRRNRGQEVGRLAASFVEWSDGRWWSCTRALETRGMPVADADDEICRAVDGAPKPAGLGNWFSRMRYEGITINLRKHEEPDEAVN